MPISRASRYLLLTVACAVVSLAASLAWLFYTFPRAPYAGAAVAKVVPIALAVAATLCFSVLWFVALLIYTGSIWLRSPATLRDERTVPITYHSFSLVLLVIVGTATLRQKKHSDDFQHWDALTRGATVELADFRPLIDAYSATRHNERINSDWRRQVLHFATLNHGATPEYLTYLAAHLNDESDLLPVIAVNPNTPEPVLRRCAQIPSCAGLLAQNPTTPPDVLTQLAASSDSGVRGHTAANPSTPRDIVVRLSNDSESWIRSWAADNLKKRPQ